MQHRNPREDTLLDSAASLRMADGILRDLVETGAVDPDASDLASILAVTYDEIVGLSMELGGAGQEMDDESSHTTMIDVTAAIRAAASGRHTAEAAPVLRLTEHRLEALARMIEGSVDEPFLIQ